MGALIRKTEPAPIRACTVSRDVQEFEFLIDDMEALLADAWGDLAFSDMLVFFDQPDAQGLEFLVLAVSSEDTPEIDQIERVISEGAKRGVPVILVASDLDPVLLHRLMRAGAKDFLPYPVPEHALEDAIARAKTPLPSLNPDREGAPVAARFDQDAEAALIAVHPMAGGVGATTIAANLAWEIANQKKDAPRVVLLDLDLQFGQAATYLDLPRKDAVFELFQDVEAADADSLPQALIEYKTKMHVLTAPPDMLPLDLLSPAEVEHLLKTARARFDFVVVDMPRTLVAWTETVLLAADFYMPVLELDMRSAQNTLRFLKTLQEEDLPTEKLRFLLNRAPKFTDLNGRARMKRMAESLGIKITELMPDGGDAVLAANEQGAPLSEAAAKNPLRKEIARLAKQLQDLRLAENAQEEGKKKKKRLLGA